MITIKEVQSRYRFPTDWFFERTERLRGSVEDLNREELIDLLHHVMGKFSQVQGRLEEINSQMEDDLGWNDPLKK